jgi:hypothetical protein
VPDDDVVVTTAPKPFNPAAVLAVCFFNFFTACNAIDRIPWQVMLISRDDGVFGIGPFEMVKELLPK